jgi:hypothetical protein
MSRIATLHAKLLGLNKILFVGNFLLQNTIRYYCHYSPYLPLLVLLQNTVRYYCHYSLYLPLLLLL